MKISVAMATYNGEKYIKEQIDSIIKQSVSVDEIIISDDGSNDKTIEIINTYCDSRLKLIEGPRKGIKKNFENAIKNSMGDIVFLADQDDIWEKNKVERVLEEFNKNDKISLVIHDAEVFDSDTGNIIFKSFFDFRKSGSGIVKNIYKNTYIGCCMAFKKELKKYILPIPNDIEMHDQWIGIINEKKLGKSVFIKEKLLKYRRHRDNNSDLKHNPIKKMVINRVNFIKNLISV